MKKFAAAFEYFFYFYFYDFVKNIVKVFFAANKSFIGFRTI